jgi:hypothetical protein
MQEPQLRERAVLEAAVLEAMGLLPLEQARLTLAVAVVAEATQATQLAEQAAQAL